MLWELVETRGLLRDMASRMNTLSTELHVQDDTILDSCSLLPHWIIIDWLPIIIIAQKYEEFEAVADWQPCSPGYPVPRLTSVA